MMGHIAEIGSAAARGAAPSRRRLLRGGLIAAAAAAGAALAGCIGPAPRPAAGGVPLAQVHHTSDVPMTHGNTATPLTKDVADKLSNPEGLDPMGYLTAFDYGKVSKLPDGRTLREWEIVSYNKDIEVAP